MIPYFHEFGIAETVSFVLPFERLESLFFITFYPKHVFTPRSGQEIAFCDVNDTKTILLTHSVAPHSPGRLFTVSPSILAYADLSKVENWLRYDSTIDICPLDCTETTPKASGKGANSVITFRDICFVEHENEKFMIVAENEKLFAKNTVTGFTEWMVQGRLPGRLETMSVLKMTTDGSGHLYVCDHSKDNKGIQMFSVSEGFYLGCLIKEGQQGMGAPISVHWSEGRSYLLVVHYKNDQLYLSSLTNETTEC